jgi:hypothetical protein
MDDAAERVRLVNDDVEDAVLGDARLNFRVRKIAKRLAAAPASSFPESLVSEAELEGFYRFLGNEKVTHEAILKPHSSATIRRLKDRGTVLVAHDNTEMRFGGEGREGLGRVTKGGNGFFAHFCLAVSDGETRDPLGILDFDIWTRSGESPTQKRKKGESYTTMRRSGATTEQDRWFQMVERVEASAGESASLVHLMDSEADDYALLANLVGTKRRFVLRLCYDRVLNAAESGSRSEEKVREFFGRAETLATRDIFLARRNQSKVGRSKRNQARSERTSQIAFSARSVVIVRPLLSPRTAPETLRVNIVSAREVNAPTGETPVEWLLLTTEPIETRDDLLAVVDMYRCRWLIEEFFKSLKTGCAFESRQLETGKTIFKSLALFTPIAWALLRMRTLSRLPKRLPIGMALTPTQIKILKAETGLPLRLNSSVLEGCLAVARLGGHIKNNGMPGWQVLGRGYDKLLSIEVGYKIAKRETSDR